LAPIGPIFGCRTQIRQNYAKWLKEGELNGNCPLADWLVGFCPNFGDKIAFLFE